MAAFGLGVATTGHAVDGNVGKSLETVRLHPLWNIRGDIAIARDMLARRVCNDTVLLRARVVVERSGDGFG